MDLTQIALKSSRHTRNYEGICWNQAFGKTKNQSDRLLLYSPLNSRTRMSIEKVNITKKLGRFSDHWNPRIVAELNGQHVKVAKLLGEFIWHQHEHEDEMFLVLKGVLTMEFRDKTIDVGEGEFVVVPRKVEHRPVALSEVEILLFEPATTLNTGNVINERTKTKLEKI